MEPEKTKNEDTKENARPAVPPVNDPIVFQGNERKRYLIEGALIVFSVLLALFLNEVRSNWQAKRQTREIVTNLREEIEHNRVLIRKQYEYLTLVMANIDSALTHEPYRDQIFRSGGFGFNLVAPEGTYNVGFISDIAWEVAREHNISAKVDLPTITLLTIIYNQQELVNQGYQGVNDIQLSRAAHQVANADETLRLVRLTYKALSYDRMPYLLRSYDDTLEKLADY